MMSCCTKKLLLRFLRQPLVSQRGIIITPETLPNNTIGYERLERIRRSRLNKTREMGEPPEMAEDPYSDKLQRMRMKYPEFLPRTEYPGFLTNPPSSYRDRIREMLEREDMYRRREILNIPEFYAGSIMAVTVADPYSPGKTNRFLGICIQKAHQGLFHKFTLRNVIDKQGVEIMYHMYNPTIQKIETILLQKRLDDELFYLRDAPLEYSTFPQDMEPALHPKDAPVPVNPLKVRLNPRPWLVRWERMNLKGVEDLEPLISEKAKKKLQHPQLQKPWEKHDIMLKYRKTVNPIESAQIYSEMMKREKKEKKFQMER